VARGLFAGQVLANSQRCSKIERHRSATHLAMFSVGDSISGSVRWIPVRLAKYFKRESADGRKQGLDKRWRSDLQPLEDRGGQDWGAPGEEGYITDKMTITVCFAQTCVPSQP